MKGSTVSDHGLRQQLGASTRDVCVAAVSRQVYPYWVDTYSKMRLVPKSFNKSKKETLSGRTTLWTKTEWLARPKKQSRCHLIK